MIEIKTTEQLQAKLNFVNEKEENIFKEMNFSFTYPCDFSKKWVSLDSLKDKMRKTYEDPHFFGSDEVRQYKEFLLLALGGEDK